MITMIPVQGGAELSPARLAQEYGGAAACAGHPGTDIMRGSDAHTSLYCP